MYKGKKIVGIIPARSGSKGLVNKNIKEFKGKPLLAHTIDAAKESGIFDKIIVSTDSKDYVSIASQYGAASNFRPKELSDDLSSSLDVIEYVLIQEKQQYDYFVLLQPTSPLRSSLNIREAMDELLKQKADSLVSVCEAEHSPLLMGNLSENKNMSEFIDKTNNTRRQDLKKYYRLNGAMYIMKSQMFLETKDFYGENSIAYVMDKLNSIDIDDHIDFAIAECLFELKSK